MICDNLRIKKGDDYVCTTDDYNNADNLVLPQKQALYTETQKVRHFTFVFNIFVFLQIFNIINSRKIEGELNVFSDFFNNFLFLFVIILTIAVQIFIVEYGSMATKCVALSKNENLVCIAIGFSSLIWGFILKFIPIRFF
jgi:magnesium-transporting ATPase (P-type)